MACSEIAAGIEVDDPASPALWPGNSLSPCSGGDSGLFAVAISGKRHVAGTERFATVTAPSRNEHLLRLTSGVDGCKREDGSVQDATRCHGTRSKVLALVIPCLTRLVVRYLNLSGFISSQYSPLSNNSQV